MVAGLLALSSPAGAYADEDWTYANPYGLDIAGDVQDAASDEASVTFQENYLPTLSSWINSNLKETSSVNDLSGISLDPSQLYLSTASDVRVYFVGEGAGYWNTLGFTTDAIESAIGDGGEIIFPNASTQSSYLNGTDDPARTYDTPLLPGDFVDLGTFDANTQLDFFLIAQGALLSSTTSQLYSTDSSLNLDGIAHVISYAIADSPYLLIGFEDMWNGGDKDYNDLLFAIDIGTANVAALTTAPEPSTLFILGTFLLAVAYLHKRQQRQTAI
ncbi:DUF4114 domain-containing protein [Chlorobium sp. N1]|uniref:DUF4114 domain-containing protein n=1 Tax=Chlorobium sp. N1 TaxID=2491138 RepID=UPI0013F148E4|nr:DUF4114 domain-containing protein [Chlorobium sp. N1]